MFSQYKYPDPCSFSFSKQFTTYMRIEAVDRKQWQTKTITNENEEIQKRGGKKKINLQSRDDS